MSDGRVRTRVRTPSGWLEFQEFFVRERCRPEVLDVVYEGADGARPSPGVIFQCDLIGQSETALTSGGRGAL